MSELGVSSQLEFDTRIYIRTVANLMPISYEMAKQYK
jgi:hypothetical protein